MFMALYKKCLLYLFKARAKIPSTTTRQLTMTKKTKRSSKMTNQILIISKMKKNLKGKIDHFYNKLVVSTSAFSVFFHAFSFIGVYFHHKKNIVPSYCCLVLRHS